MSSLLRHICLIPLIMIGACKVSEPKSDLPPQPPIWVVSDADSEITLFPTIHILPKEIEWKSDEMKRRIAEAEEVWFEIMPGSENDPALQQLMAQLGMAPGSSISTKLTETEVTVLKRAIEPLGLPFAAADMMRPWMLSNMVSVSALIQKGFDPTAGVETQLKPLVEGKKVRALETAKAQMEMLASIPEETQMEMLREILGEMDESIDELHELAKDWSVGNVSDMEDDLLNEMKRDTPKAYDIVFTQRNKNWVEIIEREMKGSGTDFIAVGAGHLVGEDGVPAMLKARGYNVKRL